MVDAKEGTLMLVGIKSPIAFHQIHVKPDGVVVRESWKICIIYVHAACSPGVRTIAAGFVAGHVQGCATAAGGNRDSTGSTGKVVTKIHGVVCRVIDEVTSAIGNDPV